MGRGALLIAGGQLLRLEKNAIIMEEFAQGIINGQVIFICPDIHQGAVKIKDNGFDGHGWTSPADVRRQDKHTAF
jgi:hypothetical protein